MEYNQRETNTTHNDITALIKEANDPRDRAMLIVLAALNDSINACTDRLNAHLDSYAIQVREHDEFVRSHDELVNKGKGSWQVISVMLAIAQLILIAGFTYNRNEIADIHKAMYQIDKRVTVLEVGKQ